MLIDANWSSLIPGRLPIGRDFKWVPRKDVVEADRGSERLIPLGDVWRELTLGQTKVVDHFTTEHRCYVVVVPARLFVAHERPCQRNIHLLESILLDGNPKSVAIDLGLAASSVTVLTKHGLSSMGIQGTLCRVPPQFVMATFAANGVTQCGQARLSQLELLGLTFMVVSVPRPDNGLSTLLPPAEFTVARLFVEGKTHSEIATLRGASKRTVANQLASVFQRLGVSGRIRLLGQLATNSTPRSRAR